MKFCLPLLFLSVLLSHFAYSQSPRLRIVKPPKTNPWQGMRVIKEDYEGYLWIGSIEGLYRYDGFFTTAYHSDQKDSNTISNNWVESLYADEDSLLFIGTYGGGLDILHLPTGHIDHYRFSHTDVTSISNDTILAIAKDRDGYYWVGTNAGLNRFDKKSGKFTRFMNDPADTASLSDNQVRVVYADRQGTIWVGTKSPFLHDYGSRVGGLNRYDSKTAKFKRYMHNPSDPQSLISNEVSSIFEDSKGTFWVGTSGDGLHTMDRANGKFQRHRIDRQHPHKLSRPPLEERMAQLAADHITFINEDKEGNIWIGTLFNGINVYNPSTGMVTHLLSEWAPTGPMLHSLASALRTTDGRFYIATWGETLYQAASDESRIVYKSIGKEASDFQKDPDGTLWTSTVGGLLKKKH